MHYSNDAKSRIAAEYVLGLASRPLARAVRRRMRRDAELAAAVAQWETSLHTLADAVPAQDVPDDRVWSRIAAELPVSVTPAPVMAAAAPARAPAASPGPVASVRHWWQNLWLWQGWAVAASAAAVVLGLQTQVPPPPGAVDAPTPAVIAGAPLPPSSGQPPSAVADAGLPAPAVPPQAAGPAGPDDIAQAPANASADAPVGATPSGTSVVRSTSELAAASGEPAVVDVDRATQRRQTRGLSAGTDEGADAPAAPALVGVLSGTESGGAAWLVRLDRATGALRVRVIAEQTAGADRDFELWAVPRDGGPPRSLGLISGRQDTLLSLDARLDRSVRQSQVLAVSVEPTGGSTTGGPTGPVRFAGPMLSI